ncbi:WD40 repeat domain-containing protein [Streptomyces prunicolor]|uniref:WD40 repeat domain-containing protein n=1 Tax=Streptomyces prunicolor TaxID=67348 RepID=UPI0004765A6A|nr:WD40 repeat domain-containing protein [Streptomyces prunicolor]
MGRQENPVDPEAGPVARFAHELRALRKQAGSPTYREMAGQVPHSVATLARAAAGVQLPTLQALLGYVEACGGNTAEWEQRWRQASEEIAVQEGSHPPYRGLFRFETTDRGWFFGRDRLVAELLDLVERKRFSALLGASGSGKSSLLRAGLIPPLREAQAPRLRPAAIRVLTPGEHPMRTHAGLLKPDRAGGAADTLVIVDQFEEAFTLCADRGERADFIELLLAAREPDSGTRVVLALRADFYGHCAEHRQLAAALCEAHLLVGPMNAQEVREAITGPAAAAGLTVERSLTAALVSEVAEQPGSLPMLSQAMLETWRRRQGKKLTLAAYQASGGLHGAIATTAEDVYSRFTPGQARIARHILLRLIAPGDGAPDTRRRIEPAELESGRAADTALVLDRLTQARLLVLDDGAVELAHEALIDGWQRLRSWIDEDRERLRRHRRLTQAAQEWEKLGKDPGALYRGERLATAEEIFRADVHSDELTTLERTFLAAGTAHRDLERQTSARISRRLRILGAALTALLVLAAGAGLVAWQQNNTATRERTSTLARRVASAAANQRVTNPQQAMLLGVAAWRTADIAESRSALLGAWAQREQEAFTDPGTDPDTSRLLSADGRTLISVTSGTVQSWDVATQHRISRFSYPGASPGTTALPTLSPDARTLALGTYQGTRLWDLATGRPTGAALGKDAMVESFGPSGRTLVVDQMGSSAELRDAASGRTLLQRPTTGAPVAIASPGDRMVAVCSEGQPPQLWDVRRQQRLTGPWDSGHADCTDGSLAFSPDGRELAATSSSGVRIWSIADRTELQTLSEDRLNEIAYSPDGRFMAAGAGDQIVIWRLSEPLAPVARYPLANEMADQLRWDPSTHLLRFLDSATVRSLDVGATVDADWHTSGLDASLLSPNGSLLGTAQRKADGFRFVLTDLRHGRVLNDTTLPLPPPTSGHADESDHSPNLAFSPDSGAFAFGIGSDLHTAPQPYVVYDVPARRATRLDLPGRPSLGIALGPGGSILLVGRMPDGGDPTAVWTTDRWDTRRRVRIGTLSGISGIELALRPDGRFLATSFEQLAPVPAGPVTTRILNQGSAITALAFSGDGRYLAVGDREGRITIWNGAAQHRLGTYAGTFTGSQHGEPEPVLALAFSHDGHLLAAAGQAGTLQLWDTTALEQVGQDLPTPGEAINSIAFSPDNDTLLATSAHVPLQSYSIAPRQLVAAVCRRTNDAGLSRADWQTYLPEEPYQPLCTHPRLP